MDGERPTASVAAMTALAREAEAPSRPRASPEACVLSGLDEVQESGWNRLVGPRPAGLSYRFLRAWERAVLAERVARPVAVREPGSRDLLAAAAAYHYELDLATVSVRMLLNALNLIRHWRPRLMKAQVSELGAPVPRHDPLLLASRHQPWPSSWWARPPARPTPQVRP